MIPILSGNVASALPSGYDVANSCRLNDDDSAYMHKTCSSAFDTDKFTISVWCKRGALGIETRLVSCDNADGSDDDFLKFDANDNIEFTIYDGGYTGKLITNAKYRDVSAWYHIVAVWDSANGTAGNRMRLYVNGTEVTSFSSDTNPTSGANATFGNTSHPIEIGRRGSNGTQYFDGYIAEVAVCDGQAYAASDFGEFSEDSPNIWMPKDISGLTFGTSGFYLDFEDSSNLGNDANGGTDFTEVNLAATDQASDSPTNNFATLNPLVNFNSGVFSEGNLAITYGDDTISTIGVTKGRWYWEAQRTNTTNEAHFGIGVSTGFYSATSIVSSGDRLYTRGGATFFSAVSNLSILTFGSNGGTSATVSNGDVMGFYLDLESGTKNITIKKNDGATPIVDVDLTYSGAEPIFAFCRMNSGCASSWNFGNPIAALSSAVADANGYGSSEFNPTKGGVDYYALCTKNLAEFG